VAGGRHICADPGPAEVSPSSANSVTTLSRPPPKGIRLLLDMVLERFSL
jgi:hypothetical protein